MFLDYKIIIKFYNKQLSILFQRNIIAVVLSLALIASCLAEDVEYCPQEVSDKCPIKDSDSKFIFCNWEKQKYNCKNP